MAKVSRARMAREARRAKQFSKFKLTELNLVPLVDTFVSIVFFALTTATVGELIPVVPGVTLPESRIGASALQQVTLGIGSQILLGSQPIMNTADAAQAVSDMPGQPLEIPQLYSVLKTRADSLRTAKGTPVSDPVDQPLAIQGDRTMRYDLLSRVMQTARLAGFKNISLEVKRNVGATQTVPASLPTQPAAPAGAPPNG
jgi:biopolymer transport protein ExbD